jgi:pimeloyl-ACP methyl ester carboxylesterase
MATQQTAKTQYIEVNGVKHAYRRFGLTTGVPLVFLQHFRGTMDHWDPNLTNPLAKSRPIVLVDLAGVGLSDGEVGATFADWAADLVAVVEGLGIKEIDLLGFSMGGMAAQMVALNAPHLVRRLILAGTGPSVGEGVEQGPSWAFEMLYAGSTAEEAEAAFLKTFYSGSKEKQALGKQWWARVNERQVDRAGYLGPDGTARQTAAIVSWLTPGDPGHSYDRLVELKIPVFVASGAEDILVPTANSIVLWRRIKTAHLHVYPDVGHGFLNEYAGMFAEHINLFLDGERVM